MGKHGIVLRGDSLYCPLPLAIEPYWWCEPDCPHCSFRALNHVWGRDLRPVDIPSLEGKLISGLKNKHPQSPLSFCLHQKKTIRIGSKTDPFQPPELQYKVSTQAMNVLRRLKWSFTIQTRFTNNLMEVAESAIYKAARLGLVTLIPVISPGRDKDWELLEQKKTPPISERLQHIIQWKKQNVPLGVQGEPFIPGFHTVQDFEDTVRMLKGIGVNRYNTYNFHFNAHVAKRMVNIPGVDIERIWEQNQDRPWRKTLGMLLDIAKKYDMILGCPDFVNSGPDDVQQSNTCCGVDVPNPCTFNTHHFKLSAQSGTPLDEVAARCWDHCGDWEMGNKIINGGTNKFYTLRDAGIRRT